PIYEWVNTPDPEPEPEPKPKPETNPIPENKSYFHTKSGDTQSGSYLTSATSVLLDVAPVYNSARTSYNHFKSGSYVWGGIFVVLAVSDVIPYATGFKVVSKLLRGIFKGAKASKGTAQVLKNKAKGDTFRDEIADLMKKEGLDVEVEVYKKTPFGKRFIDIEVSNKGRVLGGIETKTGKSRYGPNQRSKDKWLQRYKDYPVNVVRDQ
ncbi:MAG: hypothetical protein GY941_14580, partial [Planctomycetes bacterium]|nr:hypothetical protein [Planctomycetota bacterium]